MDLTCINYIDGSYFYLSLMTFMSMLHEKTTLSQIIWLENMSLLDKGKAAMEQLDSTQLIQNFEDILINVNEYYETVNEKIEVIEEIVVDLRADLGKVRELTTYFHQTIWTA